MADTNPRRVLAALRAVAVEHCVVREQLLDLLRLFTATPQLAHLEVRWPRAVRTCSGLPLNTHKRCFTSTSCVVSCHMERRARVVYGFLPESRQSFCSGG